MVFKVEGKMVGRWGTKVGDTCAIPHPKDVDAIIKKVAEGKLITINIIREKVAKKYKATIGCLITCGIFTWICANAAEEEGAVGKKNITPWWRVLKGEGFLNEKYPGVGELQKKLLEGEGQKIEQKGKKYKVVDWEKKLVRV